CSCVVYLDAHAVSLALVIHASCCGHCRRGRLLVLVCARLSVWCHQITSHREESASRIMGQALCRSKSRLAYVRLRYSRVLSIYFLLLDLLLLRRNSTLEREDKCAIYHDPLFNRRGHHAVRRLTLRSSNKNLRGPI